MTEFMGYLAAVLTTVAFLPQTLHTIRTRDTRSISLGMYIIFTLGVISWLTYGITSGNFPIIMANIVTLIFTCIILYLKLKHG